MDTINDTIDEIKPGRVYTPKETRDFLKVSESTMKRMIKSGIIKSYKVSGQYRIWGHEILRLVSPKMENKVLEIYRKVRGKTKEAINEW
ncbi:MAG: helix-turn-helix domain-containing protein [Patescibacteria group bacterium]